MNKEMNDIEESIVVINTNHILGEVNEETLQEKSNIRNNKLLYLFMFLFLSTSGFIIYDHYKDIEYGFIQFGKLF